MSAKTRSIHSRSNPKDFSRIFKTRWASWGVIGLLWIPFILLVLPILESSFAPFFRQIGIFFIIISIVFGFYFAYLVIMWIARKLPNSEFGIWLHRIVATILFFTGALFAIAFVSSAGMAFAFTQSSSGAPVYSMGSFVALIVAFCIGIALFAGYMEFLFERKAGILIFSGNQRF
jgi:hypothetical protein